MTRKAPRHFCRKRNHSLGETLKLCEWSSSVPEICILKEMWLYLAVTLCFSCGVPGLFLIRPSVFADLRALQRAECKGNRPPVLGERLEHSLRARGNGLV